MEMTEQIAVLIPSLSPDEKLLQAVKEVRAVGFSHILIVNDGSDASYQSFFNQAEALGAVVKLNFFTSRHSSLIRPISWKKRRTASG